MGILHASDRLGLARRIQCASAVPATVLSERSRTLHFAAQTAPGPSILHPKRSLCPPFCAPNGSQTLHFQQFCTPNGAFPLHFAPQNGPVPSILHARPPSVPPGVFCYSVFEAIPGQTVIQKGSSFGRSFDFFIYIYIYIYFFCFVLEKVRPLRNMHRHERIACGRPPGHALFVTLGPKCLPKAIKKSDRKTTSKKCHKSATKCLKVPNQVPNHVIPLVKKPPNPLKRLVGAQGFEPWTRCLKGSGFCNDINVI